MATIDELERICKEQKLRELPRMGAKLEEKVLKSIAQYRQRTGRFLLSFGQKVAGELIPYLSETGGIEKIAAAGSLRRGKDTIGDLDLLVTGPGAPEALERFVTASQSSQRARQRPQQSQHSIWARRPASGSARAPARKLRRGHAVFHRQQGTQHPGAQPRA